MALRCTICGTFMPPLQGLQVVADCILLLIRDAIVVCCVGILDKAVCCKMLVAKAERTRA
jgi:hypothetical protein